MLLFSDLTPRLNSIVSNGYKDVKYEYKGMFNYNSIKNDF